jgi:hypothetical protein
VELGRLGAAVDGADADEHVVEAGLGVFHRHVEVAARVEDTGVNQLELGVLPASPGILLHEPLIGKGRLRILVEELHVGMGGRGVEVEVVLLHVFAVIALGSREAEQALLEDRIAPVPEREGEAEPLMVVRDAADPVLPPAVGPRPGVIVGEVVPGRSVGAVVLAHRAPLSRGEIGAPAAPVSSPRLGLEEALLLWNHCHLDSAP